MQAYSNAQKTHNPRALPDLEIFFVTECDTEPGDVFHSLDDGSFLGNGWYYWYCSPGCLPDSDPCGPFETEEKAHDEIIDQDWTN
jgi:hypothetical protein